MKLLLISVFIFVTLECIYAGQNPANFVEPKLVSEFKKDLDQQEREIATIREVVNLSLAAQDRYIGFLSYLTGVVIGFVTLVFAAGAYLIYKENRYIYQKTQAQLEECAKLKVEFQKWFSDQEVQIKKTFVSELKEYQRDVENLNYFMYLRTLLESSEIHPAAVYIHLTPLVVNPKLLYGPLFEKILAMNINQDITDKAREGIENLRNRSSQYH